MPITMQSFMILAIIGTDKDSLENYLICNSDNDKVIGALNVGEEYLVMVCTCKVCHCQLLCKVS